MNTNTGTNSSDEYPIAPSLFTATLRQQRATRLKGGLYHLNQVLVAYNTNRIEGSSLDEDQTRYIYETQTISGAAVPVDDVIETANSFRLFDEMLDGYDEPITADTLKSYHRVLKTGTLQASSDGFAVGDWKRTANSVGGQRTTPPEHVALAVEDLLARTPSTGKMSFNDIADFHHRFESIHPFQDGNGRVGRTVMFQQCLQNNIMPFIVLDSQKEFYYRGLKTYDDEPGFLRDTLRSFQDSYYERFSEYVPVPESVLESPTVTEQARNENYRRFPELQPDPSEPQQPDDNQLG